MKWTYTIKNKVMASAALLALCVLVLVSNYIDRDHTENVKKSISTLYEDRLIAEDYILKMTSGLYQVKEVVHTNPTNTAKTTELLAGIKSTSDAYHKTVFTELEKIKAAELLGVLKSIYAEHQKGNQIELLTADKALGLLDVLSAIQLAESKEIMKQAEKLYLSGKTSSQFVFAVIILILIVLQALVFTSKTLVPKVNTDFHNLN